MPRLVTYDSLAPRPWKNGGGTTRQIACFPPAAGLDDFDWRISTAHVAQDGAFSQFPGVDRWLSILDGAGLALDFAGKTERLLPGGHLAFDGGADVTGRLIAGPVTDFNVMARRGRWRMDVRELRVDGAMQIAMPWDTGALFVLDGAASLGGHSAQHFDTLLCEGPAAIAAEGSASLLLIGFASA